MPAYAMKSIMKRSRNITWRWTLSFECISLILIIDKVNKLHERETKTRRRVTW
jgi:hypothetical protein